MAPGGRIPRPTIPAPERPAACAQSYSSPGRRAVAPFRAAPTMRPVSSSRSSRRCREEGGGIGVAMLQYHPGSMAPFGPGLNTGSGNRDWRSREAGGGGRGKEEEATLTLRQRIRDGMEAPRSEKRVGSAPARSTCGGGTSPN